MEDDMGVLSNLEPKEVFEQFEALSMVPRRTYRDEKISDYCAEFAKRHGLEYVQEESGNIIIYKPGTAGYEDSEPVILQGHMDMVASKTLDSDHDFDTEPLELFVEDGYIGAKNTTLGGDDGIALAYAMAVLARKNRHAFSGSAFRADSKNSLSYGSIIGTISFIPHRFCQQRLRFVCSV